MLYNGFLQLFQSALIKLMTGLIPIGLYLMQRNLLHSDTIHFFWYHITCFIIFYGSLLYSPASLRILVSCTSFFRFLWSFRTLLFLSIGIRYLRGFLLRCFGGFQFCGKECTKPLAQCLMLPSCHAL